jgi:hypothetical protein
MPRLWRPVAPGFVMPKVGDTVWYYFEHAFWDGPPITMFRLSGPGLDPVEFKQWRFAGRTELRGRPARVTRIPNAADHTIHVTPEYDTTDRIRDGVRVCLALRTPFAICHLHRRKAGENVLGRIVDGVLPRAGTWGFDPLPPIGGGR